MTNEQKKQLGLLLAFVAAFFLVILFAKACSASAEDVGGVKLDEVLHSYMRGGSAAAAFESKVTRTTTGFLYWYRVENTSKVNVLVQWDFLDVLFGNAFFNLIALKPGESKEFSIASQKQPQFVVVTAVVFQQAESWYENVLRGASINASIDSLWRLAVSAEVSGFFPKK